MKVIQPFDFTNYLEDGWYAWKSTALAKADMKVAKLVQEAFPDEAEHAYSGAVSKMPVFFDEDDWRFLSQFPPELWSQAYQWRHNEGLRTVSKMRDQLVAQTGDRSQYPDMNYTDKIKFAKGNKDFIFHGTKNQGLYVGLSDLIQKLEKPVKINKSHTPPGTKEGDVGLQDIDPNETDPAHPKHHSNYKGGHYGMDLTGVQEQSDEYIDAIPDEEINLPDVKLMNLPIEDPTRQAAIAKARERMKKAAHHTFAGATVLKYPVAATILSNAAKAQAIGLHGDVPGEIKDPNTGKVYPVEYLKNTADIKKKVNPQWNFDLGQQVGEKAEQRWKQNYNFTHNKPDGSQEQVSTHNVPMNLPTIPKRFDYIEVTHDKNGKTVSKPVNKIRNIPVLNNTRTFPALNLTPEQREIIAKRRGFNPYEKYPELSGLSFADLLNHPNPEIRSMVKNKTALGDAQDLLSHYDLLTTDQKKHLIDNQRHLHHVSAVEHGGHDDPWARSVRDPKTGAGGYFAIAHHANKGKRRIPPVDLSNDQLKAVIDKYGKKLELEALNGVRRFVRFAKRVGQKDFEQEEEQEGRTGQGRLPANIIKAVENISTDIAEMAKYLNALYLNHPEYGIHDPALGLNVVQSDDDKALHKTRRENLAFNLARDISQAGIASEPPRRQRFHTSKATVDIGGTEKEGQTGFDPTTAEKGPGWSHYTRRQILNPKPDVLGRPIWNVPMFGDDIDNVFQTARNVIANRFGADAGAVADKARKKMQIEMAAIDDLFDVVEKELAAQGMPEGKERYNKAAEMVSERLPDKLKEMDPELFKSYKQSDWARLKHAAYTSKEAKATGQPQKGDPEVHRQKVKQFLDELMQKETAVLPEYRGDLKDYVYENEISLGQIPVSAADVVQFLKYISDDDETIVKEYALKLLIEAAAMQDVDLEEEEAQEMLDALGVKKGVPSPAQQPAMAPPQQPKPAGQPMQQPSIAARAIPDLLGDLPANYQELYKRRNELAKYKGQLKAAIDHLQQIADDKFIHGKGIPEPEEMAALSNMRSVLETL